ncbi:MAG: nitroreductase family protein [Anaeroplasmataceae bacterium]|nr:nitroreductase family protein [Anaeroplasmataceae bacterium]
MDAIINRRSVREYDLSKKIEYNTLLELCKAAEAAPTARNQRSREYIIIEDEKIIEELSKVSKGSMILSKCNTVIAVIGRNKEEISTPHMQDQDLACAVENILIKATDLCLGSCYIGIHPLEERVRACDEILGVSGGAYTFALVALGYPKDTEVFYDKNKFSDDLVHHNRY